MQNVFDKWFPQEVLEHAKSKVEQFDVSFERSTILPNLQVFSGHIISPEYMAVHEIWGRAILYFRVSAIDNSEIAEIEFKNSDGEFVRNVRMPLRTPGFIPEVFFEQVKSICSNPLPESRRTQNTRDISKES